VTPIKEVSDYTGQVLENSSDQEGTQVLSKEVAWIMGNILSDNSARVLEFGPNSNLVVPGKTVSVKTGTTNEKRDNWTVGYTPSYVAAVWVGNNDNRPMHPQLASGITGAAPIWQEIMKYLLKDKADEVPPRPESVITLPCYFGKQEYFVRGTEPKGGGCAPFPTKTIPTPTP
jgi:membrane peptidoglycan carboxypeptidase